MERLGFGNMYVRIATFLLFCLAPFWIFNLAAINIDNETVRGALGVAGIILFVFGLLYGSFWRIQMRKRFNLPASNFCCGNPEMTDCLQWLCCCSCSLAQEVRTVDFYEIVEDRYYGRPVVENDLPMLSPLRKEDGSIQFRSLPCSPLYEIPSTSKKHIPNDSSPQGPFTSSTVVKSSFETYNTTTMVAPPAHSSIKREDN